MAALKSFLPVLIGALFFGCATGYHQGDSSGGYEETQLAPDIFRIRFNGNGYTEPERAQDFSRLRAAELAAEHGYTHFVVMDEETLTAYYRVASLRPPRTTDTANSTNFVANPGQLNTFHKISTWLLVKLLNDSQENLVAFDAAFTGASIREKYRIEEPSE